MTKKKYSKKKEPHLEKEFLQGVLVLGHLIKYNLYLLSKSIIFSSVSRAAGDRSYKDLAELTNQVMNELDLDTKARLEKKS